MQTAALRPAALSTAAIVSLVVLLVALPPGTRAAPGLRAALAAADAGAVPDAGLDALIHADQLQLVTRGPDAAVAAATGGLGQATQRLDDDQATRAEDQRAVRDAGRVQAQARARLVAATGRLSSAVAAHGQAVAAVAADRRQLQALAIGWYTGGASVSPSAADPLSAAQAAGNADTELGLLTGLTGSTLRRDTTRLQVDAERVTVASTAVTDDHAVLVEDIDIAGHAATVLSSATRLVGTDRAAVTSATLTLAARRAARTRVVASFERSEGAGSAPVPTILGPAALTAAEMTAWFEAMGDVAATAATIGQLTSWYIAEGRAEGVRGDIAFAQAVLETGAFDSTDAVDLNNYAGVGHCDSCAAGLRFASPLDGIRGQIQLLRTYADAHLTTADLAAPPPIPSLAPEDQSVRGCCQTWNSLTGVWATDPHYGSIILDIYLEMLGFAVSQPVSQPVSPPAATTASG